MKKKQTKLIGCNAKQYREVDRCFGGKYCLYLQGRRVSPASKLLSRKCYPNYSKLKRTAIYTLINAMLQESDLWEEDLFMFILYDVEYKAWRMQYVPITASRLTLTWTSTLPRYLFLLDFPTDLVHPFLIFLYLLHASPFLPPRFVYPNDIYRIIHIMKLLITQFPPRINVK